MSEILKVPSAEVDRRGHVFADWNERTGEPVEFFVYPDSEFFGAIVSPLQTHVCRVCGEYIEFKRESGRVVTVNEICKSPRGFTTIVEIPILSGKMLVDDDLRPMFDVDLDSVDYNSLIGQVEYVKAMEKIGCAYGPILNTSPDVYRTGDGTYRIASSGWTESQDEVVPDDWEKMASICTDLWAYSIGDYETWLSLGGETIEEENHYGTRSVVDVEPGIYRFTYHAGEKDFTDYHEDGTPVIFAEFEKISE